MKILPADELEAHVRELLEGFVRELDGPYSLVLACAYSRRPGTGLPTTDLTTTIKDLDPPPTRVLLLWGAGTTEVPDPLEALTVAEPLHGTGEETLVGIHPTRPFHGKFLLALPEGEGPQLTVSFSWNMSRTAADQRSLEHVHEEEREDGTPFEEFTRSLKEDGWLLGPLTRRKGRLETTFEDATEFRFPCKETRRVTAEGTVEPTTGIVTLETITLEGEPGAVHVHLAKPMRESVEDPRETVKEVVVRTFVETLGDAPLSDDVIGYAVTRTIQDVLRELTSKRRYRLAIDVNPKDNDTVSGDETGVLVGTTRLPNAELALEATVNEILREKRKRLLEELL